MIPGPGDLPTEIEVLRDVGRRLDDLGLPYMLTGSLAVSYYAEPRMTRDIDLVVALTTTDAPPLRRSFSPDYYVPEDLEASIDRAAFFNLIHLSSVTKVDIVVRRNTRYRRQEFERRRPIKVAGFSTWIVSKEDLILSKLEWAKDSRSEIQLRDIRNLAATGYDRPYVERWVGELGLNGIWSEAQDA